MFSEIDGVWNIIYGLKVGLCWHFSGADLSTTWHADVTVCDTSIEQSLLCP